MGAGQRGADRDPADWPYGISALPLPAGWTERRLPVRLTVCFGLLAVIALAVATEAVWLCWTGQPGPGVLLAAFAIFLGHIIALAIRVFRTRRRTRRTGILTTTADGTTGVTFTYSFWAYYWLTTIMVVCEVVLLRVTAAAAASATVAGVAAAVVIGVPALLTGWFLVTMLRLAPGKVILAPAGIHHRGLASTHFIPWYAIVAVSAFWLGTPVIVVKAHPSEDTRVRRYMGRLGSGEVAFLPFMVIRTAWLASDPTTVYHALSFYRGHPEQRAELATPDALDRISTSRAVAYEEP